MWWRALCFIIGKVMVWFGIEQEEKFVNKAKKEAENRRLRGLDI